MKASVIIPVKKDRRVLRLVESLLSQSMAPNEFEIIVVENGSHAFETDLKDRVRYARLPKGNAGAARNVGIRLSQGEYVLFTDADCVAEKTWVQALVAGMDRSGVGGMGGSIERYDPRTWVQQFGSNLVDGQKELNFLPILNLPYLVTANCAFRAHALREIGGFDEQFISGNDVDICYRLGIRGYTLAVEPNAVVFHDNRATVRQHFRRFYHYAVYQVLLFKKYKARTGRTMLFNTYPYKLLTRAMLRLPGTFRQWIAGDADQLLADVLSAIEAFGVMAGDLAGSLRFRELYI